jgi:hypothetical protein
MRFIESLEEDFFLGVGRDEFGEFEVREQFDRCCWERFALMEEEF